MPNMLAVFFLAVMAIMPAVGFAEPQTMGQPSLTLSDSLSTGLEGKCRSQGQSPAGAYCGTGAYPGPFRFSTESKGKYHSTGL